MAEKHIYEIDELIEIVYGEEELEEWLMMIVRRLLSYVGGI